MAGSKGRSSRLAPPGDRVPKPPTISKKRPSNIAFASTSSTSDSEDDSTSLSDSGPIEDLENDAFLAEEDAMEEELDEDAIDTSTDRQPDDDLPPLFKIEDIFHDLTTRGLQLGLSEVLESLHNNQMRVATLCSGTECPLLALNLIKDSLAQMSHPHILDFKHQASVEIEPFKQAFIERNFSPKLLFRNILEVATADNPCTAYGGPQTFPSEADLWIAGVVCTSFSSLNNKKNKDLGAEGKSQDTFRALIMAMKRHRPKIVIIENVYLAPWEDMVAVMSKDPTARKEVRDVWKKLWGDAEGYEAIYVRVNTRNYYLPQTRLRGYMICVDRTGCPNANAVAQKWKEVFINLQRQASSTVEDFLLPNDDPRLQRARTQGSNRVEEPKAAVKSQIAWDKCQSMYQSYRGQHELGFLRPTLRWVDGGSVAPLDFMWQGFIRNQVERIWDTLEVYSLESAKFGGFDASFKSIICEASQSAGRNGPGSKGTSMGVSGCVIPSGIPILMSRGGPILGIESLCLQGLPINRLQLTKETDRELQDLAGNAMSSTVVGAAILAALIAASGHLPLGAAPDPSTTIGSFDRRYQALNASWLRPSKQTAIASPILSMTLELVKSAQESVLLCYCESQTCFTKKRLLRCKHCGHTACHQCGRRPRHSYEAYEPVRRSPADFDVKVTECLPTSMHFKGTSINKALQSLNMQVNLPFSATEYRESVEAAFRDNLRYTGTTTSYRRTVNYEAKNARLELEILDQVAVWKFYAKPHLTLGARDPFYKLLKQPIAQMTVEGARLLQGKWQLRAPLTKQVKIQIVGKGASISSWKSELGLPGHEEEKVWDQLEIKQLCSDNKAADIDIDGVYEALPGCGMAMRSLYVRRRGRKAALFFFLDQEPIGGSEEDRFVFSTNIHRLSHKEVRDVAAVLDSKYRLTSDEKVEVMCSISGEWHDLDYSLVPLEDLGLNSCRALSSAQIENPIVGTAARTTKAPADGILRCNDGPVTIMDCAIPQDLAASLGNVRLGPDYKGVWRIADRVKQGDVLRVLQSVVTKVQMMTQWPTEWIEIKIQAGNEVCDQCCPEVPEIKWAKKANSTVERFLPFEEPHDAARHERAFKERPTPFVIELQRRGAGKRLSLAFNIAALVHRVLGYVPPSSDKKVTFRLVLKPDTLEDSQLKQFSLKANTDDDEAFYTFPTGIELRADQKRSLHWMRKQEATDFPPFLNMELEEIIVPHLSWRAEARASWPSIMRGGVLADDVGYGKTATSLALIDAGMGEAIAESKDHVDGRIPLKATLIIVPAHLVHQWQDQVVKFLGEDYVIICIQSMTNMKKLCIRDFQHADIIIVSAQVFESPVYYENLTAFAGHLSAPGAAGRAFNAWLDKVQPSIESNVNSLRTQGPERLAEDLKNQREAALAEARNNQSVLRKIRESQSGSADKRAAVKKTKVLDKTADGAKSSSKASKESKAQSATEKYEAILNESSFADVKISIFDVFEFHRIMDDEFVYQKERTRALVISLRARHRWLLSGTIPLKEFSHVSALASRLGVHLGTEDESSRTLRTSGPDFRREKTNAEIFRSYKETKSLSWHKQKHEHAQKFLDHYVRRNVTDNAKIPLEIHFTVAHLSHVERIFYLELQHKIMSQNNVLVRSVQSDFKHDRAKRMAEMIEQSQTPSEALLKRCFFIDFNSRLDDASEEDTSNKDTDEEKSSEEESSKDDVSKKDGGEGDMDIDDAVIQTWRLAVYETRRDEDLRVLTHWTHRYIAYAWYLHKQCLGLECPPNITFDKDMVNWKKEIERNAGGDGEARTSLLESIGRIRGVGETLPAKAFWGNDETKKAAKRKSAKAKKSKSAKEKKNQAKKKAKTTEKTLEEVATVMGNVDEDVDMPDVEMPDVESTTTADPLTLERYYGLPLDTLRDPPKSVHGHFHEFATACKAVRSLDLKRGQAIRSIRFVKNSRLTYEAMASHASLELVCDVCQEAVGRPAEAIVLGSCGHVYGKCCEAKLIQQNHALCSAKDCRGSSEAHYKFVPGEAVSSNNQEPSRLGSKMDLLLSLIQGIPPNDQILVFVQFEELLEQIAGVLKGHGIKVMALTEDTKSKWNVNLHSFQESSVEEYRVLMLNLANESVAGANITNASHVIFVSPLHVQEDYQWHAQYTQAVGRARRYGQKKPVHVYHCLAAHTIDVDVMEKRLGTKLCKNLSRSTWSMVPEDEVTDLDRRQDWRGGFIEDDENPL